MRNEIGKSNINKRDYLIYTALLYSVSFIYVGTYINIAMTITALMLGIIVFGKKGKIIFPGLALVFVIMILYILFGLAIGNEYSQAITESLRLVIYIMVLMILSNIEIEESIYDVTWKTIFVLCVGVQIIQFFKIYDINSVLIRLYPEYQDSSDLILTNYSTLKYFRSGSIFLSCNTYFKMVGIVNAITLNNIYNGRKHISEYVILFLTYVSALFTGSRTCLAIIGTFLLIYIIFTMKNKHAKVKWMFIPVIILFAIGAFGDRIMTMVTGSRFFQISQTGSFDYKIRIIGDVLRESNAFQIIFGRGPYTIATSDAKYFMDSDIGYMIAYYGIVFGIFFAIAIIRQIGKYIVRKESNKYRLRDVLIIVMIALSAMTSGVLFNYRVFSLILLAVIPVIKIKESRKI